MKRPIDGQCLTRSICLTTRAPTFLMRKFQTSLTVIALEQHSSEIEPIILAKTVSDRILEVILFESKIDIHYTDSEARSRLWLGWRNGNQSSQGAQKMFLCDTVSRGLYFCLSFEAQTCNDSCLVLRFLWTRRMRAQHCNYWRMRLGVATVNVS